MGRRSRKSGGNKGAVVAELATASKTFIILDAIRKGIEWTLAATMLVVLPWYYYAREVQALRSEMQSLREESTASTQKLAQYRRQLQTLQATCTMLSHYHASRSASRGDDDDDDEVRVEKSGSMVLSAPAAPPPPPVISSSAPPPPPPPPVGFFEKPAQPYKRTLAPAVKPQAQQKRAILISEDAIRSVKLRSLSTSDLRSSANDENAKPNSPLDQIALMNKEMKSVRLRRSDLMRSPGGTPMRAQAAKPAGNSFASGSESDEALASALRRQFAIAYPTSPTTIR